MLLGNQLNPCSRVELYAVQQGGIVDQRPIERALTARDIPHALQRCA